MYIRTPQDNADIHVQVEHSACTCRQVPIAVELGHVIRIKLNPAGDWFVMNLLKQ